VAKCKLDINDPKFRAIGCSLSDADLQSGLAELQAKVLKDHRLSNWVNHPINRFPLYQNRIWKWDFAPVGDRSSTRPGWRLMAYVPDPAAPEPIPARAFLCYDKTQDFKGERAKQLAKMLQEFLAKSIIVQATPDRFRRQHLSDGKVVSLCLECCGEPIFSDTEFDADAAEAGHECPK